MRSSARVKFSFRLTLSTIMLAVLGTAVAVIAAVTYWNSRANAEELSRQDPLP